MPTNVRAVVPKKRPKPSSGNVSDPMVAPVISDANAIMPPPTKVYNNPFVHLVSLLPREAILESISLSSSLESMRLL